jgi:hypothetical protein
MTIHIGEITTEVVATPAVDDRAGADEPEWVAEQRLRQTVERLARDRARTAAWNLDD